MLTEQSNIKPKFRQFPAFTSSSSPSAASNGASQTNGLGHKSEPASQRIGAGSLPPSAAAAEAKRCFLQTNVRIECCVYCANNKTRVSFSFGGHGHLSPRPYPSSVCRVHRVTDKHNRRRCIVISAAEKTWRNKSKKFDKETESQKEISVTHSVQTGCTEPRARRTLININIDLDKESANSLKTSRSWEVDQQQWKKNNGEGIWKPHIYLPTYTRKWTRTTR